MTLSSIAFIAVTITAAAISVQTYRLDRATAAARSQAMAADSLAAAHDSSRALMLAATVLPDSIAAEERRALQVDQRSDSLEHALDLERAARDSLSAAIVGFRAVIAATQQPVAIEPPTAESAAIRAGGANRPTQAAQAAALGADAIAAEASDTARHLSFDVRAPPYTVHADVELPPTPAPPTMTLAVDLDTLRLEVRLECGPTNAAGVRSARTVVTGPRWAAVKIGHVEQSADVCSQRAASVDRQSWFRSAVARLGVSVGFGATVSRGAVVVGPSVMIAIKAWQ